MLTFTEDDPVISSALPVSDSDQNDVHTFSNLQFAGGAAGAAGVTVDLANGTFTIDPNAYNSLAVNETDVVMFSYTATDSMGQSAENTVEILITGVNDAPVPVSQIVSRSISDPVFSNTYAFSDPDLSDTVSVTDATIVSGNGAGVTLNANGYTVDPAAYGLSLIHI